MGEAREPRGVGDAWLGSPRCGETAGPAEVGLGAFSDCQEPAVWLQRAPRGDCPQSLGPAVQRLGRPV